MADLDELVSVPGGDRVQTDEVLHDLARRGPDSRPWSTPPIRKMPLEVL